MLVSSAAWGMGAGWLIAMAAGRLPDWQIAAFLALAGIGGVWFCGAEATRLDNEERRKGGRTNT